MLKRVWMSEKMKIGTCLDIAARRMGHSCGKRFCLKFRSFQRRDMAMWFGDITEKDMSEVQILTRTIRYIRKRFNSNLCSRLQENENSGAFFYQCHCLAQTVWYPEKCNFCLVWDIEEIRAIGLPDHQQKVTVFVMSSLLVLWWIEENVMKNRE